MVVHRRQSNESPQEVTSCYIDSFQDYNDLIRTKRLDTHEVVLQCMILSSFRNNNLD